MQNLQGPMLHKYIAVFEEFYSYTLVFWKKKNIKTTKITTISDIY